MRPFFFFVRVKFEQWNTDKPLNIHRPRTSKMIISSFMNVVILQTNCVFLCCFIRATADENIWIYHSECCAVSIVIHRTACALSANTDSGLIWYINRCAAWGGALLNNDMQETTNNAGFSHASQHSHSGLHANALMQRTALNQTQTHLKACQETFQRVFLVTEICFSRLGHFYVFLNLSRCFLPN